MYVCPLRWGIKKNSTRSFYYWLDCIWGLYPTKTGTGDSTIHIKIAKLLSLTIIKLVGVMLMLKHVSHVVFTMRRWHCSSLLSQSHLEHPRDMPNPYMEVEDPILDSVLKLFLDEVSPEPVSAKIISVIDQINSPSITSMTASWKCDFCCEQLTFKRRRGA